MSGGSTFSDVTLLVPETTPQQRRRAGIILTDLAAQAGASRQELRDALEAIGLVDYESQPGYDNGHKPRRQR